MNDLCHLFICECGRLASNETKVLVGWNQAQIQYNADRTWWWRPKKKCWLLKEILRVEAIGEISDTDCCLWAWREIQRSFTLRKIPDNHQRQSSLGAAHNSNLAAYYASSSWKLWSTKKYVSAQTCAAFSQCVAIRNTCCTPWLPHCKSSALAFHHIQP